ncbi:MAG: hypothetical protein AB7I37_12835 [Pirellulales bacterium]
MAKNNKVAEYGDFQTPAGLAHQVCARLALWNLQPASLVEPTCGMGSLLLAGRAAFPGVRRTIGADINGSYVQWARNAVEGQVHDGGVSIFQADFFATDWERVIGELPAPTLVLGNLPWVTNSHLESIGSQNLPVKSNFQSVTGIAAITGKSNFDISEWMMVQLMDVLQRQRGVLAMLCKSSVARKALAHAWKHGLAFSRAEICRIDAAIHFNAAVDAVLLMVDFQGSEVAAEAPVYATLQASQPESSIGYEDGILLSNAAVYRQSKQLSRKVSSDGLQWRSGVKHDCAKVMEFRGEGGRYRNGLGELIELEAELLYPLVKSSEVASDCPGWTNRWMLVTQQFVGEETAPIQESAPKTWAYLTRHAAAFEKRGSAIYRNRPPFSMFGVGPYTFAPWKVAISGFYKRLSFATLGPVEGKPLILDDTAYFLPCQSEEQASFIAGLLNSPEARSLLDAMIFWDSKRPITADILRWLDLHRLAVELGLADRAALLLPEKAEPRRRQSSKKRQPKSKTLSLWPE